MLLCWEEENREGITLSNKDISKTSNLISPSPFPFLTTTDIYQLKRKYKFPESIWRYLLTGQPIEWSGIRSKIIQRNSDKLQVTHKLVKPIGTLYADIQRLAA